MSDLVFIHGAGDSAAVWEQQVERFSKGTTACALELPGHGARLRERAHDNHAANAREVVREIERRGLRAPVVIGHSMGGAVALTLALEHPRVARGLVLVATGARMRMRRDLLEAARRRAEDASPEAIAGPVVPVDVVVSPACSPDARRWVEEHTGGASAQAQYADFLANDRFDVMNELGRIGAPSLVIGGTDDRLTPPKFLQYLGDHIPGARLEMLDGAGHYLFVEQADIFSQLLRSFFGTL